MAERTGMVPQNAVRALFGLRVGVECDCSGPIDVSIGELRFRDGPSPETIRVLQDRPGPYLLRGVAGQKASINTTEFAVHAGASYAVHAAMRVREPNQIVPDISALFFLDATGKEIRRDLIELKAPAQSLGTPITDREGLFALHVPATVDPSRLLVQVRVGSQSVDPTLPSPRGSRGAFQLDEREGAGCQHIFHTDRQGAQCAPDQSSLGFRAY